MATNKSIIQARYDAKNCKVYSMKYNRKTDADIIEKLDSVPSRQDYIRQLIRQDLAGSVPNSVPVSVPESAPNPYQDPYADIIAQAVQAWHDTATSVLTDGRPYIVEESVPENDSSVPDRVYGMGKTNLVLTKKAQKVYDESGPLNIIEHGSTYDITGIIECKGLSADDVSRTLEEFYDELND